MFRLRWIKGQARGPAPTKNGYDVRTMRTTMKKWLVRGGLVVLCGVIVLVVLHVRGRMALSQKIAELKAQGLPTTFAELEAQSRLPEGTPNAADIYMKAFAAYRPLADAEKQKLLPVIGERPEPEASEPYPQEQMDAAREFVEQNQEMFRLLHEAGQVETCYYPMDYSCGPFPDNDFLMKIKQANESQRIAIIYFSRTNQPQKAYDMSIDHLRLGQSLSRNPDMVDYAVRMAILSLSVSSVEQMINQTSIDESQLSELQEYLQQIEMTASMGPALVCEICLCLEFKNLKQKASSAKAKKQKVAVTFVPENTIKLIEAYQQMIEIYKLALHEQPAKIHDVIENASNAGYLCIVPKMILPDVEKMYEMHLRVRATMECAITALAIERYRMKEGALPETVEALVPEYLPAVYVDPFDGKPLRYKRGGAGYMVYTIGADGVDDEGWEPGPDNSDETFDWVFRVER